MNHSKRRIESGQILVIFSVAIIAFIAILALVLDGGLSLANRRGAQNAADAGALAGARVYCTTENISSATVAAQDYAINRNEADQATVTFDTTNKIVTVVASINADTSFAHLIGFNAVTSEAVAQAGCVSPGLGEGVLPVAFSCLPPLGNSDSDDCQMEFITYDELQNYIANPYPATQPPPIYPELYIIMEDDKDQDDHCAPPWGSGFINCDLDNDGDPDIALDGGRSWLDLNGGSGGASELSGWITNGYPFDLQIHTWVPDQSGVANSIFQAVGGRVGDIVALPIIDLLCEGPPQTNCSSLVHPNGFSTASDVITVGTGASQTYYHITGFAAFYISCVKAPGVSLPGWVKGGDCPGHKYAKDVGAIDKNEKSIEGYFIQGFIPGFSGGALGEGVDTGIYVLLLTK
jgi:hypothetical protein